MSEYTSKQLDSGTLVGLTAELGNPWWGKGHFDGAVPIEEARKLLTVDVAEGTVRVELEDPLPVIELIRNASTIEDARRYADVLLGMRADAPDGSRFKAVVDRTEGYVFQVASSRWSNDGHQYETMLDHASALLDVSGGSMVIGSVIALDHRQKAMVQVRPTEGVTVGGDKLLPWLAMFSSLDSSWASGIKGCWTRAVCDNTSAMVVAERTARYARKHTKNTSFQLSECRRVLEVFHTSTELEVAEIERLMNTPVTVGQFGEVAELLLPLQGDMTPTATTRRTNERQAVWMLYAADPRVAPFKDTAWGILQAWNTHSIHGITPKNGKSRTERQAFNLIGGHQESADGHVKEAMRTVGILVGA